MESISASQILREEHYDQQLRKAQARWHSFRVKAFKEQVQDVVNELLEEQNVSVSTSIFPQSE